MANRARTNVQMTEGPIIRNIIRFAVPLLLTGLLQILFNATDTIVVGRFAGHVAMAAIGSTTSLTSLMVNLFMGLGIGVNVVVARYYGARNAKNVQDTVHTAITVSVFFGLLLAVVANFGARTLLTWMGTPPDVIDKSVLYMRIIFLGMPVNLLYNFGAAVLRAVGDTKRPLMFLSFGGVINVVTNLFFVIVLHMSVAGVAIATILSQGISAFLVVRTLMKSNDIVHLDTKKLGIHWKRFVDILYIGVPAGFQSILFSFSNVIVQSSVNSFGSVAIAGNTAGVSLDSFVYMTNNSLAQTNLSFISQNYGAGKRERIYPIMRSSILVTFLVSFVLGNTFYLFHDFFLGIYAKDPEVIAFGNYRLKYLVTFYFIYNIEEVFVSTMRGFGYSFQPMFVSIFSICGFRILWVLLVFRHFGTPDTLYLAYPLSWLLALILQSSLFAYFFLKKKALDQVVPPEAQL